jgi:hypothetical protein
MKIFTSYTTYPLGGENTIKGANKTKVKVFIQGFHMTSVISMLVYNFKICILNT